MRTAPDTSLFSGASEKPPEFAINWVGLYTPVFCIDLFIHKFTRSPISEIQNTYVSSTMFKNIKNRAFRDFHIESNEKKGGQNKYSKDTLKVIRDKCTSQGWLAVKMVSLRFGLQLCLLASSYKSSGTSIRGRQPQAVIPAICQWLKEGSNGRPSSRIPN